MSDDLLDAVRLNMVRGVGPRTQMVLLERFGSPGAVLRAPLDELRQVAGVGPKIGMAIVTSDGRQTALQEIERCQARGIRLVRRGTPEYPASLDRIIDPPLLVYCRGTIEPCDELAVAIVGSRRSTPYGQHQAERLATALSHAGLTIVSGLARGIDAAAHRGALNAGGRTIAVSATGLATIYPPEHAELATDIAKHGAVVSESCLEQSPVPGLFPQRNRIISGLSLGVILIEASRNSGALHTARHAMEQGREVLAVPGRIDSPASEGCHDLIRDGATLVRGPDDVLEALGPLPQPVQRTTTESVHTPRELNLGEQERLVLNLISNEPQHLDEVLRAAGIESSRVLSTVTVLEMKRLVRRLPGGYLIRAPH